MSELHCRVGEVLIDIEKELRELMLWEQQAPTPEALSSSQPFCIDTLTFPQWLQFIFLPRMHSLVQNQQELPHQCGIAPMAEEYFSQLSLNSEVLIRHIGRVDEILSAPHL